MLKRKLEEHNFASTVEVRTEMTEIFMNTTFDEFIRVFDE
jgi:hypothetical protein